jgi:hypothetical protein
MTVISFDSLVARRAAQLRAERIARLEDCVEQLELLADILAEDSDEQELLFDLADEFRDRIIDPEGITRPVLFPRTGSKEH